MTLDELLYLGFHDVELVDISYRKREVLIEMLYFRNGKDESFTLTFTNVSYLFMTDYSPWGEGIYFYEGEILDFTKDAFKIKEVDSQNNCFYEFLLKKFNKNEKNAESFNYKNGIYFNSLINSGDKIELFAKNFIFKSND